MQFLGCEKLTRANLLQVGLKTSTNFKVYFRNFTWLSQNGDRLKFDLSWAATEAR